MKLVTPFLLGLVLALPAAAADAPAAPPTPPPPVRSPEALEILKKVDTATKAVNSVSYHAVATPRGIAERFGQPAEGDAVLVGWTGTMPQKFWAHLKTKRPKSGEPVEITGGGDGSTYYVIDQTTKKAYEDMDPGVLGSSGRLLLGFGMVEFVHDTPFDDELNAESVTLLPSETVSGEECNKINVVYGGRQGESVWYFAKSDNLPRKRVRKISIPNQGDGEFEVTISNLKVNFEPEAALFKLKLPEGYQQVDDFAP
jgi:hypothetical protein